MLKYRLPFAISILTILLSACGPRSPESAPGIGLQSTSGPPPPPPSQGATATPMDSAPADPLAGLFFHQGWARIPFDASVFGGAGADQMNDVIAGGPGVVAAGYTLRSGDLDAAVWVSSDGISWQRVASPDLGGDGSQRIAALALGPGGLIAVGSETLGSDSNAAVWHSVDGLTWGRVRPVVEVFGGTDSQVMNHVTAFGDGFVAVGSEDTLEESRGAVWLSPDGFAWRRVAHDDAIFGGLSRYVSLEYVFPVGNSLLATGAVVPLEGDDIDVGLWFSHDGGEVWTEITNSAQSLGDPGDPRYQFSGGIVQTREGFFMAGTEMNTATSPFGEYTNGLIWYSADGVNWERVFEHKPEFRLQTMLDIAAFDGGFAVVGFDKSGDQTQAAVWLAPPDGSAWTQVQHSERVFGGAGIQQMTAVAVAGPGLVAVGTTTENGDLDAVVWIYIAPSP